MKQRLCLAFFCSLLLFQPLFTYAKTDLDILKEYTATCKARQDISNVEAHFAPVIKLNKSETQDGQTRWNYKYANEEKSYPNNRILLSDGEVKRIFFVTSIKRQNVASSPTYQWHVIAVPRVVNPEKPYDGLWAESRRCIGKIISEDEWLRLLQLSSLGNNPAHNVATETSKRAEVNQEWRRIFGDKVVNDLLIESARNRRDLGFTDTSYDYTFYYAPVPSLDQINPEGFRWVSSRLVTRPGIAYGLVLNARGECIESAEVLLVAEE